MATGGSHEAEFIIPTRYKTPIASYLSWPVGAMELTKVFLNVPQIKELQLVFGQHYPIPHQGKWPVSFSLVEARYTHPPIQILNPFDWELRVFPVPRNLRAEVRESLEQLGFNPIADWLLKHSQFSGRASNLRFSVVWKSELKELTFESRDYLLPEVSAEKRKRKQ